MKFILKHNKSEKDIVSLRQEIEILRGLRHENIIQMLDSFETQEEFCVVTEFAQGMYTWPFHLAQQHLYHLHYCCSPSMHKCMPWGAVHLQLPESQR